MDSPYLGLSVEELESKTKDLIRQHPLDSNEIYKSGYYLAVNFEKFSRTSQVNPGINLVRFGWLDLEDWQGQRAATGQQARLSRDKEGFS